VAGLVAVNWWGVFMPAGTPKPVVDKFHGDMVKVMADAEVKRKFADLGVEAISSSQARFAAFLKSENEKYSRLIKEAGIKGN
jgi:tripartite-type tricarboxylate transporter receptor subunit TctC